MRRKLCALLAFALLLSCLLTVPALAARPESIDNVGENLGGYIMYPGSVIINYKAGTAGKYYAEIGYNIYPSFEGAQNGVCHTAAEGEIFQFNIPLNYPPADTHSLRLILYYDDGTGIKTMNMAFGLLNYFFEKRENQSIASAKDSEYILDASWALPEEFISDAVGVQYQWETLDGSSWTAVSGGNQETLVVPAGTNDRSYRLKVDIDAAYAGQTYTLYSPEYTVYNGSIPNTGDSSTLVLWFAMLTLGLGGIALLRRRQRAL